MGGRVLICSGRGVGDRVRPGRLPLSWPRGRRRRASGDSRQRARRHEGRRSRARPVPRVRGSARPIGYGSAVARRPRARGSARRTSVPRREITLAHSATWSAAGATHSFSSGWRRRATRRIGDRRVLRRAGLRPLRTPVLSTLSTRRVSRRSSPVRRLLGSAHATHGHRPRSVGRAVPGALTHRTRVGRLARMAGRSRSRPAPDPCCLWSIRVRACTTSVWNIAVRAPPTRRPPVERTCPTRSSVGPCPGGDVAAVRCVKRSPAATSRRHVDPVGTVTLARPCSLPATAGRAKDLGTSTSRSVPASTALRLGRSDPSRRKVAPFVDSAPPAIRSISSSAPLRRPCTRTGQAGRTPRGYPVLLQFSAVRDVLAETRPSVVRGWFRAPAPVSTHRPSVPCWVEVRRRAAARTGSGLTCFASTGRW